MNNPEFSTLFTELVHKIAQKRMIEKTPTLDLVVDHLRKYGRKISRRQLYNWEKPDGAVPWNAEFILERIRMLLTEENGNGNKSEPIATLLKRLESLESKIAALESRRVNKKESLSEGARNEISAIIGKAIINACKDS